MGRHTHSEGSPHTEGLGDKDSMARETCRRNEANSPQEGRMEGQE